MKFTAMNCFPFRKNLHASRRDGARLLNLPSMVFMLSAFDSNEPSQWDWLFSSWLEAVSANTWINFDILQEILKVEQHLVNIILFSVFLSTKSSSTFSFTLCCFNQGPKSPLLFFKSSSLFYHVPLISSSDSRFWNKPLNLTYTKFLNIFYKF